MAMGNNPSDCALSPNEWGQILLYSQNQTVYLRMGDILPKNVNWTTTFIYHELLPP
jgi:hypothetical protein